LGKYKKKEGKKQRKSNSPVSHLGNPSTPEEGRGGWHPTVKSFSYTTSNLRGEREGKKGKKHVNKPDLGHIPL